MAHGHIEGNARAQAGLLEDHAQHFAFEKRRVAAGKMLFLQPDGEVKDVLDFSGGIIGHIEKVFHFFNSPEGNKKYDSTIQSANEFDVSLRAS
jgi:hypothetical protein